MGRTLWLAGLVGCVVALGCSRAQVAMDEAVSEVASKAMVLAERGGSAEPMPTTGPMSAPPVPAAAMEAVDVAQMDDGDAMVGQRLVIREAQLRLRSGDPRAVADEATRIAGSAGGFVLASNAQTIEGTTHELVLQLRVPEASLDAVMGRLRGLGTVLQESVTGQDVTEEFVDVSARLKTEHVLEQRLLALLEGTAALKDMLAVEQELARVRSEIERKEARVRYPQERARMASIELSALAPEQPAVARVQSLGSRLSNAARQAFEVGVSVVEFAIVAVGFVVPAAIALLCVLVPLTWLRRRRALGQRGQPSAA